MNQKKPMLICIAGGIGCGKSSLSEAIVEQMQVKGKKVALPTDEFFKYTKDKPGSTASLKEKAKWILSRGHMPSHTDLPLMLNCLEQLLAGKDTSHPIVIRKPGKPKEIGKKEIKASEVIIIEGHRSLQHEEINKLADLKIYLDVDADLRMVRTIKRNPWYNEMIGKKIEDGRMFGENLPDFLEIQVDSINGPHKKYVEPTKKHAGPNLE